MILNYILDKIQSIDGTRGSRKAYHLSIYSKITKYCCPSALKTKEYQELVNK